MPDLSHLKEQPDHIKEAQATPAVDPRSKREWQFDFSWTDPSKQVWAGKFTSTIPNIRQQIDIAKRVATRSHGTGAAKLPDEVGTLIETIAYLTEALTQRPPWAQDLENLPYIELVFALAGEATGHLDTFRKPAAA